jgi:hypothetical protein
MSGDSAAACDCALWNPRPLPSIYLTQPGNLNRHCHSEGVTAAKMWHLQLQLNPPPLKLHPLLSRDPFHLTHNESAPISRHSTLPPLPAVAPAL